MRILLASAAIALAGATMLLGAGSAAFSISPPNPAVGDPITIEHPGGGALTLEKSDAFEVVSIEGGRAVIRSFRPGAFKVSGTVGDGEERFAFRDLEVKVVSVLEENDSLEPAALRPPRDLEPNRVAWGALALASLATILAWVAAFRRRAPVEAPPSAVSPFSPSAEFRARLDAAAGLPRHDALVAIGEAARTYLARIDRPIGVELTSREVRDEVARRGASARVQEALRDVLFDADLEKFSLAGAPELDVAELVERAGTLTSLEEGETP